MAHKTYSVFQIARYILAGADPETNDISNLKLQKLCYYLQGFMSAMRGTPLFKEAIYAWDHGPVIPELYHHYKGHKGNPIPPDEQFSNDEIHSVDRDVANEILSHYGQYSAWYLRNLTHEDQPWKDAYADGQVEIPVEALASFFRPQINDEYIEETYGQTGP